MDRASQVGVDGVGAELSKAQDCLGLNSVVYTGQVDIIYIYIYYITYYVLILYSI